MTDPKSLCKWSSLLYRPFIFLFPLNFVRLWEWMRLFGYPSPGFIQIRSSPACGCILSTLILTVSLSLSLCLATLSSYLESQTRKLAPNPKMHSTPDSQRGDEHLAYSSAHRNKINACPPPYLNNLNGGVLYMLKPHNSRLSMKTPSLANYTRVSLPTKKRIA